LYELKLKTRDVWNITVFFKKKIKFTFLINKHILGTIIDYRFKKLYNIPLMSNESKIAFPFAKDPQVLRADHEKAVNYFKSSVIAGVEVKIQDGTATPTEIKNWYLAQDSLEESLFLTLIEKTETATVEGFNILLNRSHLFQQAARVYLKETGIADDQMVILDDIKQKALTGNLTYEQAKNLLFGTEMYSTAGKSAYHARISPSIFKEHNPEIYQRLFGGREEEIEMLETTLNSSTDFVLQNTQMFIDGVIGNKSVTDRRILGLALKAVIVNNCETAPSPIDDEIIDVNFPENLLEQAFNSYSQTDEKGVGDRIKATRLKLAGNSEALIAHYHKSLGRTYKPSYEQNVKNEQGKKIIGMLTLFEQLILDPERGLINTWEFGSKKGKLMEALWVLDSFVYLYMHDRFYVEITPASGYEDFPHTNYPNINRGVDIFVFDPQMGNDIPIQLGTGKDNKAATSHPAILIARPDEVLEETNEQKFDEKIRPYLTTKFAAYWALMLSGFGEKDQIKKDIQTAEDHVMTSVKNVFAPNFRFNMYDRIRETYGLTPDPHSRNISLIKNLPYAQVKVR
jgi:hypothetical protein